MEVELLPGFETATGTDELLVEIVADNNVLTNDYPGGEGSYESYGYYRYGFNGQEKSDEIKGSGNSYAAEFWEYDPRLGRRWNVDPVVKDNESPFMTFGNNPIVMIDPSGADWYKNNSTGNVAYKSKWLRKHKGYEYLGKGKGDVLSYEGKEYNKKTGTVAAILDNVEVTAKSRKKSTGGAFPWPKYTNADVKRYDAYHAMVSERHNLNQPLVQENDP